MKRTPPPTYKLSPEQIRHIEDSVFALVESQLDPRFFLLNVCFEKEAGYWYLRIYLDGKDAPVSLSDCEQVSRALDPKLEEFQPLSGFSYSLEVSSPGVFRPLTTAREFEFYRNRPVRIEQASPKKSKAPRKTEVATEGLLQDYNPDTRTLTLKNSSGESLSIALTPEHLVCLNPVLNFPEDESGLNSDSELI
ncbi:MAG TPA: hypothetical protein V6C99_03475 [Oculatellaceae cyanobacterium]|jgi:ribosome maturation factor RimP